MGDFMDKIIETAKKISINSIKSFLKKLEIDENLLNEIYNIEIVVNNVSDNSDMEFDHENFKIIISPDYLAEITNDLLLNPSDDQPIKYLAKSLIHEMLHANRTIDNLVVSEYYTSGNDLLDSINQKYNITNDEKIEDTIISQRGFEESITEVIALIIFLGRNSDDLCIDHITERIRTRSSYNDDEKVAALIVKDLGTDMLKWFMTSTHTGKYHNYFKEAYGSNYEKLVHYVNSLYYNQKPDFATKAKAEVIITENKER